MLNQVSHQKCEKCRKRWRTWGSTQINTKNDGLFKAFYQFPFCTQKNAYGPYKSRLPALASHFLLTVKVNLATQG